MISKNDFKAIAELDLDPIKVKLMHKESGEGWTLEYANAVEFEYRRFLYLMKKFPNAEAAPQFDVDIFWHYHILDTMKYAVDCEHVYGYFLHHFPYVGLRGEDDEAVHERAGVLMQELYEDTFGEPYLSAMLGSQAGSADADDSQAGAAARKTAYSWITGPGPGGAANKTAYSWITGPGPVGAAQKTAYSWITPPGPGAAEETADMARFRRLHFERPTLAAA